MLFKEYLKKKIYGAAFASIGNKFLKARYGDLVRNMCHLPQPRGPIFKLRFLRLNTHL